MPGSQRKTAAARLPLWLPFFIPPYHSGARGEFEGMVDHPQHQGCKERVKRKEGSGHLAK